MSIFIVYNSSCQDLDPLLYPEKSEGLQNCPQFGQKNLGTKVRGVLETPVHYFICQMYPLNK